MRIRLEQTSDLMTQAAPDSGMVPFSWRGVTLRVVWWGGFALREPSALPVLIHPDRKWLAACWSPMAGILDGSLQEVEVDPLRDGLSRWRLSALFVALQINRLPTQRVLRRRRPIILSLINLSRLEKELIVFQSQSEATGGGRLAVFGCVI